MVLLLSVKLTVGNIVDVNIEDVVGGFKEDMLNGGIGLVHGDCIAAPNIESNKYATKEPAVKPTL